MKTCRKGLHQYVCTLSRCPHCYKLTKAKSNKNWVSKNRDKVNISNEAWAVKNISKVALKNKKWYEANKVKYKSWRATWEAANRDKMNSNYAKRRARKLRATPKWLTAEQHAEMSEFYKIAQELAWLNQDGKPLEVDHIVPLCGKNVCGLHVPWNLQLLSKIENRSKGNRNG